MPPDAPASVAPTGSALPAELQGKSPEDLARMYLELSRKLGTQGQELGSLRQALGEWEHFGASWSPLLERIEYQPARLAQLYEQGAVQAAQAGQPQQAQQMAAAAQQVRTWAGLTDPRDQESWLTEQFETRQQAQAAQYNQQLQDAIKAVINYQNRYGDLALRAVETWDKVKGKNPNVRINDVLQQAIKLASGQAWDPVDWAGQVLTHPQTTEAAFTDRLVAEKAKWQTERDAETSTAYVGAGGGPRPYRTPLAASKSPNSAAASPTAGPSAPAHEIRPPTASMTRSGAMNQARQSFVSKFNSGKLTPPSSS